jgi:choline dehydrogenase-like flavoprotein
VHVHNPGVRVQGATLEAVLDGKQGADAVPAIRRRFERSAFLSVSLDDLPQGHRAVTLSGRRDSFGLPLNRVAYRGETEYAERTFRHLLTDLPRRLAPLGVRSVRAVGSTGGSHMLGTCAMGRVVDADLAVRGAKGLYVVGGAVFPAYSAAWPTLTIAALAIRLGEHLSA